MYFQLISGEPLVFQLEYFCQFWSSYLKNDVEFKSPPPPKKDNQPAEAIYPERKVKILGAIQQRKKGQVTGGMTEHMKLCLMRRKYPTSSSCWNPGSSMELECRKIQGRQKRRYFTQHTINSGIYYHRMQRHLSTWITLKVDWVNSQKLGSLVSASQESYRSL